MYNLFSRYPIVSYNGTLATNILTRVQFKTDVLLKGAVFYPYTVKDGERPDHIATSYYDDPRYTWVIFLANRIVDPYYDWPLDEDIFKDFLVRKYGSYSKAYNSIAFWRNNWVGDERVLSPSLYESLPAEVKQYWAPIKGYNDQITAYQRKQIDEILETNKIQELSVASAVGFRLDEVITQSTSGNSTATATIKMITSDNKIMIQNVIGTFLPTAGAVGKIVGEDSTLETNLVSSLTVSTAISSDQSAYWSPITFYDYENEINEAKRHIRILDRAFIDKLEKELDELL